MTHWQIKRTLWVMALPLILALFSLHFFGSYRLNVEGLEFNVRTSLAVRGTTQIEVPPLGLVRASTHHSPVMITIRLNSINLEQVQNVIKNDFNQKAFSLKIERNLRQEAQRFVGELLLMALASGFFGVFLLRSTKISEYLLGGLVSLTVIGLLLFSTYRDYNVNHFSNPEYEGALKAAPWMIGIAEEALVKIDTLSSKLQLVAENINLLYNQIDTLQPIPENEGTIKVLHVSDIHNNPAALEVVRRMADLFEVNFIIDTGDISDFGTPLEGLLLERIRDLPVPYVFVAGNHDSPETIKKMQALGGNVKVLNHSALINGINIVGFHDPASYGNEIKSAAPEVEAKHIESIRAYLRENVLKADQPVDILAVHSPYVATPLAGEAPVLVFGHNHQFKVSEEKSSVLVNAGTTGASGLGTLQEVEKRPYSVMLLHFYQNESGNRLLAVDSIQIDSVTAEFSMQRHLFNGEGELTTEEPLGVPTDVDS